MGGGGFSISRTQQRHGGEKVQATYRRYVFGSTTVTKDHRVVLRQQIFIVSEFGRPQAQGQGVAGLVLKAVIENLFQASRLSSGGLLDICVLFSL